MPYTLTMFLFWGLALALVGGVIGWLLRSLRCRSQLARVRSAAADGDEVEQLRRRLAEFEPVVAERDRLRMELADVRGSTAGTLGFSSTPGPGADPATPHPRDPDLDMAAAGTTLGRDVDLDDLTIVEGIGPDIADLCSAAGITTWRQLAATDISTLARILTDGGSRFAGHDPGSWPRQAGLLADGRWEEFTELTRQLDGGS